MKTVKISLKAIIKGGATCANPSIVWESPYCGDIKCVKQDGKEITLEIPDECIGECLYATISCEDTCATCEPQRIKVCPCDSNANCADCEDCINGLCVSKCPTKICVNGDCADCDDEHPCPNNQVCVNGSCKCPPDKPFKNSKGICVDCEKQSDCPPCHICTENGCVPIDCKEGVCDPRTNTCVECNVSGDCGLNECCKNNKCDCCEGFVRNPKTGLCELAPDCTSDTQCPPCFICSNGKCVPVICPEGFICVNGKCVQECDCNNPNCGAGKSCIPNGNKCYCASCSGGCVGNGDCGEGCYCKNGQCTPNPCANKSCSSGLDCGEGCGCQDGQCVPCDSLSCTECANVLGCKCTNNKCNKVTGCSGNCGDSSDCGEGCTCVEGKCVSCEEFSCTECVGKKGCACLNGKCKGSENTCNDTFRITKDNANCDLTATLVKEEGCACSKITVDTKLSNVSKTALTPTSNEYRFNFLVELRKGSVSTANAVNTLSLLGDLSKEDIAENEKPTSGVVELRVTPFYKELDAQGRIIGITAGTQQLFSGSYSNVDAHTFANVKIEKAGDKISDFVYVDRVEVEITHKTKFVHPNGCEYKGDLIAKYTFGVSTNFDGLVAGTVSKDIYTKFVVLSSDKVRNPLFTWYKSKDSTFTSSEIFRKLYIPLIGGQYSDTLKGMSEIIPAGKYPLVGTEGELWSGYSYLVKTDCGCVKDVEHLNLVFCNPTELDYEVHACNREITLLPPFVPCDMNEDINKYKTPTNPIPNDAQAKYQLYFDGVLKATFVHNKDLGMVKDGTSDTMFDTYVSATPVSRITLKHIHDVNGECDLVYDLPQIVEHNFEYELNCDVQGSTYVLKFNKVGDEYEIANISSSNAVITEHSTYFNVELPKGENVQLVFTLDNGCVQTRTYNQDCCSEFTADLTLSGGECGDPLVLATTLTSGQPPFTYTYTKPDGSTFTAPSLTAVSNWIGGLYKVKVVDANGCEASSSASVSSLAVPTLTFSGYSNICDGETTNLIINGSPSTIGKTITYELNGSPLSFVMPTNGTYTISGISSNSTFANFAVIVDGCQTIFPNVITISVISAPFAELTTENDTLCAGSSMDLQVFGTVGATVTLSNGQSKVINGSGYAIFTVSPTVSTTYTLSSVMLGSCSGDVSGSTTITVASGTQITYTTDCTVTYPLRKYTFNYITTALDQNDDPLSIVGSSVTVDTDDVSVIKVSYDNGSCTTYLNINVQPCPCPAMSVDVPNYSICVGHDNPHTFTPSITGGTAPYTYAWSNGSTASTFSYLPSNIDVPATYTFSLVVTDANGCTMNDTFTYTVLPEPTVMIKSGVTDVTNGRLIITTTSTLLTSVVSPSGGTYSWDDTENTGTSNTFLVSGMADNETRTVTLTYIAPNGCTKTVTVNVTAALP